MNGIAQYQQSRKISASNEQILVMLMQTAVLKLEDAEELLEAPAAELDVPLHHVRAIFIELSSSLDGSDAPELVNHLGRLYSWIIGETVALTRDRSTERLKSLQQVVCTLEEAWQQAVEAA